VAVTRLKLFGSSFIIDRAAGKIIRLVASVCVCVRPYAVGALLFEPFDT